ncbi:MAG: AEC family transporter [Eubacteriaceae bacterium]|nr:malate permease [Eubacteriaceae bacterium]MDK2935751.1 malate permease [Eubacteriaceae bacterium]
MDIGIVISQMLELFFILGLGYLAARKKIVSSQFGNELSRLILNITLPCLMLSSVAAMPTDADQSTVIVMFVLSILFFTIMPFVAYGLTRVLRIKSEDRNLYIYMTTWSNVGFMGFPVIASIFGTGAIFYATIFNLVFNFFNFTLGVALMSEEGFKSIRLKNFLTPGILSAIIAVLLFVSGIQIPELLNATFETVGSTTTPLAMIVIGVSLAGISMKSVFAELRLYPYLLIKQILFPIAAWAVLQPIIEDTYILGIMVVIIAMPVATSAVLFSNLYENNVALATKGVFMTTLASVITIPVISWLLLG